MTGKTWRPRSLPTDGTQTEHGFASCPDAGAGPRPGLAGRPQDGGGATTGTARMAMTRDMTLRFAASPRTGSRPPKSNWTRRVCECCPTTVAMTADGPIVAYRDRGQTKCVTSMLTRLENGKWTEPKARARGRLDGAGLPRQWAGVGRARQRRGRRLVQREGRPTEKLCRVLVRWRPDLLARRSGSMMPRRWAGWTSNCYRTVPPRRLHGVC